MKLHVQDKWTIGGIIRSEYNGKILNCATTLHCAYTTTAAATPRSVLDMYIRDLVDAYTRGDNMSEHHEVYVR